MPDAIRGDADVRQRTAEPTARKTDDHEDAHAHHTPDNHLALVYETPGEQLAAVLPFIRQGLERNERVMYVADESSVEDLVDAFERGGIDVDAALDSGKLSFHSKADTYYHAGEFDAEEMIDFLAETAREVVEDDEYDRLRITGEMTWVLGDEVETLDRLVEYESKVNELYLEKPVIGLCQYNRTRFSADLLHDVIRSHPHQVYNATVTQNFSYLPPEEFFTGDKPRGDTETFVETHLDRVRARGKLQENERTLSTLAESSRDLLEGDERSIVERTITTLVDVLSPSVVALFGYEEHSDSLQSESVWMSTKENVDSMTLPDGYQALLWDTFVTGEANVFSNVQFETQIPALNEVLQSGMAFPLDRHGVLFVGSARASAFDESNVEFARTVALSAHAALERVENERTLEEQNEKLRHLNEINRTIRRIDQALVQASCREEIETVVCDRLAETEPYEFVWIGDRDPLTDQFVPREWAGGGDPYLDDLYSLTDNGLLGGDGGDVVPTPTRRALESGEATYVRNAVTTAEFDAWRRTILRNGFHSVLCVPLVHGASEYGVMSVYAGEPNVLTEMEREVLRELGSTIAYAIDAVETKASLRTDRVTELTLRITDPRSRLRRFAGRLNGSVHVESILPSESDALRFFFTVSDVPAERVLAVGEESVSVETIRHIADRKRGALFEAVLHVDENVPRTMNAFNGSVTDLVATPECVEIEVGLPQMANVREFVEQFSAAYPETDVVSVQRVTQPLQTRESFYTEVEDRLTDRQLESLRLAYHSGYFEWPRESTASEVAESLGVTQPTFNGHLRAGERKIYELLFDE